MPVTREGDVCGTEAEESLEEAVATLRNSGLGLSGIPWPFSLRLLLQLLPDPLCLLNHPALWFFFLSLSQK